MKLRNSAKIASACYIIGSVFNKLVAFLAIPIFTALLSTTDYGIVSTYSSWVSMTTVIMSIGLSATIRMAYIDFNKQLDHYITSIVFFVFLVFGFFMSVCSIVFIIKEIKVYNILIVFCLIQSFSMFVQNTVANYQMMNMLYVKRTLLLSLPNLFSILLAIIILCFYTTGNRFIDRIYPEVVINAIVSMGLITIILSKDHKLIDLKIWRYSLRLSLPLVFHSLSIMILSNLDKTMITILKNAAETGIYSIVYNFGMIIIAVTSATEGVWIPWFTEKMISSRKQDIEIMANKYIGMVVYGSCFIMLVSSELLKLMTSKEYWCGDILIPPIIVASILVFLYSFLVNVEYFYKKTKHIALNTCIASIINIVLNMIFIPRFGALAAAWTTVIAYFVLWFLHFIEVKKVDSNIFSVKLFLKPIAIVSCFCTITYIIIDYWIIKLVVAFSIAAVGFMKVVYFIKNKK